MELAAAPVADADAVAELPFAPVEVAEVDAEEEDELALLGTNLSGSRVPQ